MLCPFELRGHIFNFQITLIEVENYFSGISDIDGQIKNKRFCP